MGEQTIRKSVCVVIDPPIDDKRVIWNKTTNRYLRLGLREASFLESLDGSQTEDVLCETHFQGFSPQEISYLLKWLRKNELIESTHSGLHPSETEGARLRTLKASAKWRIKLVQPDSLLDRILPLIKALHSPWALAIYAVLIALPAWTIAAAPDFILRHLDFSVLPRSPIHWFIVYCAIIFGVLLHELAHGMTCKYFGGKVHQIGIKLLYLQPIAYCDISDAWRFREPYQKIAVASAGIVVQLMMASLAWLIWLQNGATIFFDIALVNWTIVLFNLIPFIELDGYWILVHMLGKPNFRKESFVELSNALHISNNAAFKKIKLAYAAFGFCCLVTPMLMAASVLFEIYRITVPYLTGIATFLLVTTLSIAGASVVMSLLRQLVKAGRS